MARANRQMYVCINVETMKGVGHEDQTIVHPLRLCY